MWIFKKLNLGFVFILCHKLQSLSFVHRNSKKTSRSFCKSHQHIYLSNALQNFISRDSSQLLFDNFFSVRSWEIGRPRRRPNGYKLTMNYYNSGKLNYFHCLQWYYWYLRYYWSFHVESRKPFMYHNWR